MTALQMLPCKSLQPHGVACSGSNTAIQQPRLFTATSPTAVPRRHVYGGDNLCGRPVASSATEVTSATAVTWPRP